MCHPRQHVKPSVGSSGAIPARRPSTPDAADLARLPPPVMDALDELDALQALGPPEASGGTAAPVKEEPDELIESTGPPSNEATEEDDCPDEEMEEGSKPAAGVTAAGGRVGGTSASGTVQEEDFHDHEESQMANYQDASPTTPGLRCEEEVPAADASSAEPPAPASPMLAEGMTMDDGEVLTCSMCLMTSEDKDLSDKTLTRKLPFNMARATSLGSESSMCDCCTSFIRYHLGTRSKAELQKRMGDPNGQSELLNAMAWHLALRAMEDRQRMSKPRFEHQMDLIEAQKRILKLLRQARGLDEAAEVPGVPETMSLVNIVDFVVAHGNPLLTGHPIRQTRINDKIGLSVLAPTSIIGVGRYPLDDAVSEAWTVDAPMPPAVEALNRASVDDLNSFKAVGTIVAELAGRRVLVDGLRKRAKSMQPSSRSSASDVDPAQTGSFGERDAANTETSSNRGASGSQSVVSSSTRCSTGPIGGGAPTATQRSKVCKDIAPTIPMAGGKASPASTVEKAMHKLRAKMYPGLAFMCDDGWHSALRGKEKLFNNMCSSIKAAMDLCRREQREDCLEELEGLVDVAEATKRLVQQAKAKPVHAFDPMNVAKDITAIRECLESMGHMMGDGVPRFAPSLRQLEVAQRKRGRGPKTSDNGLRGTNVVLGSFIRTALGFPS